MAWDIILPRGNEEEFANVAKKLGYKGLICVGKKKDVKTVIPLIWTSDIQKANDKLRGMIEMRKAKLIYDIEMVARKDYIHHRGSGLNQVLAALMHKREIGCAFAFSNLLHAEPYKRGQILGRMQMTIDLCRTYKVPIVLASFATRPLELRSPRDLKTFSSHLGMHVQDYLDGQAWLEDKFI